VRTVLIALVIDITVAVQAMKLILAEAKALCEQHYAARA
jgi:hypothetical protein